MKTPTYEEAILVLWPRAFKNDETGVWHVGTSHRAPISLDAVAEVWKGLEAEGWTWIKERDDDTHWFAAFQPKWDGQEYPTVKCTGNMLRDWTVLAAMAKGCGQ